MNHRVVITRLGIIAPNTNSVEHFESALLLYGKAPLVSAIIRSFNN